MAKKSTYIEFNEIYKDFLMNDPNLKYYDAYELTEFWHIEKYGSKRYNSYGVFKVLKCRNKYI